MKVVREQYKRTRVYNFLFRAAASCLSGAKTKLFYSTPRYAFIVDSCAVISKGQVELKQQFFIVYCLLFVILGSLKYSVLTGDIGK